MDIKCEHEMICMFRVQLAKISAKARAVKKSPNKVSNN